MNIIRNAISVATNYVITIAKPIANHNELPIYFTTSVAMAVIILLRNNFIKNYSMPPIANGNEGAVGSRPLDSEQFRKRCSYLTELPGETTQLIFIQCLCKGDIQSFKNLSCTSKHCYLSQQN